MAASRPVWLICSGIGRDFGMDAFLSAIPEYSSVQLENSERI